MHDYLVLTAYYLVGVVELEGLSEEIKRFVDDKEVFTLAETTKQKLAATVEYSKMIAGKMDRIASLLEELERKYDPEPVDGDESPLRPLKIQLSGSSQQSHQMEIPSHLLVEGVKRSSDS